MIDTLRARIEQLAGDVGLKNVAGFLIMQNIKAATPAAVAQRFPFV